MQSNICFLATKFLFDCTREEKKEKWLGTEHQCLCERGQNRCDLYACKNDYQWLGLSLANIVLMVNFLKLSNTEINKKKQCHVDSISCTQKLGFV